MKRYSGVGQYVAVFLGDVSQEGFEPCVNFFQFYLVQLKHVRITIKTDGTFWWVGVFRVARIFRISGSDVVLFRFFRFLEWIEDSAGLLRYLFGFSGMGRNNRRVRIPTHPK